MGISSKVTRDGKDRNIDLSYTQPFKFSSTKETLLPYNDLRWDLAVRSREIGKTLAIHFTFFHIPKYLATRHMTL